MRIRISQPSKEEITASLLYLALLGHPLVDVEAAMETARRIIPDIEEIGATLFDTIVEQAGDA